MKASEILKKYWGYDAFRPMQEEIIAAVLGGDPTFALLPTGGGKSICFQVPALMLEGICIVISPLIALMTDQVSQLNKRGIKAAAVTSSMTKRECDITLDNCIYGDYKFLYVSPERLKTTLFIERAKQMNICLLAVDEAHCISQWGYDFRPAYLEIAAFKNMIATSRIIALTATATREVKADILEKLEMQSPRVFQKSFARPNLSYSAFRLERKTDKLVEILQKVAGSSVVYVRTRKRTKEISEWLTKHHISATFYHGGLPAKARSERQEAWLRDDIRVMVATNAFGMGIDKSNVRTVIHLDLPETLEAYYQEAGRAGRDGKQAFAVAVYHTQDMDELITRIEKMHVSVERLRTTYQALSNYCKLAIGSHSFLSYPFDFEQFIENYNLPSFETYAAIGKLEEEGLILFNQDFYEPSKIMFSGDKGDAYKFQVANPNLDPIIKALLRLYGGEVFGEFVKISEKEIAALIQASEKQVRQWLSFLSERAVLSYLPATRTPTLTFITPRMDPKTLPIDKGKIEEQKKRALDKAKAVLKYVQSDQCRTQVFQRYFDEAPTLTCGTCDNDLEVKKRLKIHELPLEPIEKSLEAPRTLNDLRALLAKYSEDQIITALRILIEEKKVSEHQGKFSLTQL